ncbi:MAG TPA: putative Ig domain-containing protein [Mycobacteriales bacterium]|nr:putative Ig domain-containing protein [Mycobacteriales bacterium]
MLHRLVAGAASLGLVAGGVVLSAVPAGAAPARPSGRATPVPDAVAGQPGFHSVEPTRILDTRIGLGAAEAPLGPHGTIDVQVTGVAGIPTTGVAAVVFNLTAVAPTAGGFLTVYPTGAPRPNSSNLNFTAGQTIADEVIATVGTAGKVTVFNAVGNTHVLADISGWFATDTYYHPLTPTRLLDTRTGLGAPTAAPLGDSQHLDIQVTGHAGIPATATATAFTLTATQPTTTTFVTAYPAGQTRPGTSNLNLIRNQTAAIAAITKLGTNGAITVYNAAGSVHLIADITGWFSSTGQFTPITPTRILDTRTTGEPIPPNAGITISAGTEPPHPDSVIVSVAAVAPTASGFLTMQPELGTKLHISTVNFTTRHTAANLAIVRTGGGGPFVEIDNHSPDPLNVIVDLSGSFVAPVHIDNVDLPDAALPGSYHRTLDAFGGIAPYTWTVTAGALPAGLTLASTGPSLAAISGTPTTPGTSTFTIQATDSLGLFDQRSLTLIVRPFVPGAVWAWGDGSVGELGDGIPEPTDTPVRVSDLSGVTAVAGGNSTGYALKSDGTVWAWGSSFTGGLGDGTTTSSLSPVQVTGLTGITAIAAGAASGYALNSDGTVWAWGNNFDGQLGDGTTTNRPTPVQVTGLTGITAIAGASGDGYALASDGTVWAWGSDFFSELGDGSRTNSSVPVRVSGLTGITAIVSAADSSDGYALKSDGTVWAWGDGFGGKRGNGSNLTDLVPNQVVGLTAVTGIAASEHNGYAITSEGTAWAWGQNNAGEVGDGTTADRLTPVRVAGLTGVTDIAGADFNAFALTSDGTVWAWGQGDDELGSGRDGSPFALAPIAVAGMPPVTALAAGGFTAYALGTATP